MNCPICNKKIKKSFYDEIDRDGTSHREVANPECDIKVPLDNGQTLSHFSVYSGAVYILIYPFRALQEKNKTILQQYITKKENGQSCWKVLKIIPRTSNKEAVIKLNKLLNLKAFL